jgi:uncharacterized protein YqjF (DUF2071 family)
MRMQPRRIDDVHTPRPPHGALSVVTTLSHFAIVTYAVDPAVVKPHLDERFELELVDLPGGPRALVSVVPFLDLDFRLARMPWPKFSFGQTNYRTYVVDGETGETGVWFFGTCLDSMSVLIPHHLWKLPWYRGRIRFDCEPSGARSYTFYRMQAQGQWAPATLELEVDSRPPAELAGFPDLETGMSVLTHPFKGWFRRRDGRLGSYSVWHEPLDPVRAHCVEARFDLLDRLELVPFADQAQPHNVMVQRETEFTILLPPRPL